jgi:hypothetical protein
MQRLEAAFHRTPPERSRGPRRPGDALEVFWSEVLQFEQIAEKPARALRNYDHVRLGNTLEPSGEVWGFADDATLLRLTRSDQVTNDNQAGGNADTGLQQNG